MHFICYMSKGCCCIVTGTQKFLIEEGELFCLPKNLVYNSFWKGNKDIEFLSFGFRSLYTSEPLNFQLQKIQTSPEIREKISRILTEETQITCHSLAAFYQLMEDLVPRLCVSSYDRRLEMLNTAMQHIANHPTCSISDAASAVPISEAYLYSLFKKYRNMTPNEYKQTEKCKKAVELLTTTDLSIEEICNRLQFSSASYFRKILRKHTGQNPRDIRKQTIL